MQINGGYAKALENTAKMQPRIGCMPKGSYGNRRFWEVWGRVLRRVLGKGSPEGFREGGLFRWVF